MLADGRSAARPENTMPYTVHYSVRALSLGVVTYFKFDCTRHL